MNPSSSRKARAEQRAMRKVLAAFDQQKRKAATDFIEETVDQRVARVQNDIYAVGALATQMNIKTMQTVMTLKDYCDRRLDTQRSSFQGALDGLVHSESHTVDKNAEIFNSFVLKNAERMSDMDDKLYAHMVRMEHMVEGLYKNQTELANHLQEVKTELRVVQQDIAQIDTAMDRAHLYSPYDLNFSP